MSQYEKIKDSFEKESFRYAMDVVIIKVLNDLKSRNSAENLSKLRRGAIFYSTITMMNGNGFIIESKGVMTPELELLNNFDKNLVLPAYLIGCIAIDMIKKDDPNLFRDYSAENDDPDTYRGPLGICIIFPESDERLFYAFKPLNPADDTHRLFEITVSDAAVSEELYEISIQDSDALPPFWIDACCHGIKEGINNCKW